MTDPGRMLYAQDVVRRVLALREDLVRHDENLAAHTLLAECVPYFCRDHPDIARAREDQTQMVLHILDPDAYASYYSTNEHERPFEQQYCISVEQANWISRVALLEDCLMRRCVQDNRPTVDMRILDLSANDGWMAAYFSTRGYTVDCIDLHPGNCRLAEQRKAKYPRMGEVACGDLHAAHKMFEPGTYDAVVLFETIEHVADPEASLAEATRMCGADGRLYVSTPLEAVEQGNLPNWDRVEPKGHVRVFREQDFRELLARFGQIERFEVGPDRVMFAQVRPRG